MEKLLKNLKNSGVLNSIKVYDAMKQVDRGDFTTHMTTLLKAYHLTPQFPPLTCTVTPYNTSNPILHKELMF